MRRERVTSSSIASIGHDEGSVLEIEFISGGVYRYLGVKRRTFEEFKKAPSKGTFFLEEIREVYAHVRVK